MSNYNMTQEQERRIKGIKALAGEIQSIAWGLDDTESSPWTDARCKELDSLLRATQVLTSKAQFHYESSKT